MSQIVTQFGREVSRLLPGRPAAARRLLLTGYQAKGLQLRLLPERGLAPSQRLLARIAMDTMVRPLRRPDRMALVSVFLPCELLHVLGMYPLCAEALSCYISGAEAESGFVEYAEGAGISETYCSYHKILLGTALSDVLPKPRLILNTSLACDANNLTFRAVSERLNVPQFYVDVPYTPGQEAVDYVAGQLRELVPALEACAGRKVEPEALREAVARTGRTTGLLRRALEWKRDHALPGDVTSDLYEIFTSHLLLGTPQAEAYARRLTADLEEAPAREGVRLLWVHTIPFYQEPVRDLLNQNPRCRVVTCDMNYDYPPEADPDRPIESMARRLVYSSFNGPAERRVEAAARLARELEADGVVWFCHWGCKGTLGAAQLARTALEAAGIPVLVLDGDGCDRAGAANGQTATRLNAFVEMLEGRK